MKSLSKQATEFKREKIRELLNQCTEPQKDIFNRMYKSIDAIPESKMDNAYDQCCRTLEKNKKQV